MAHTEKPRSARSRRASRYKRKLPKTYSSASKQRLDAEISLFERITLPDIPSEQLVMLRFFETFCSKIQKCESNLIRLSISGMPAWLILYEFFRYACTERALSQGSRKFKDPGYWRTVVNEGQLFLKKTRAVPQIAIGSEFVLAEWRGPLADWIDIVRHSYLVEEKFYVMYTVPPSAAHFVCRGYGRLQRKSGRGRKSRSADDDITYLAVVLQGCCRRLSGKAMDRDVVETLGAFFEDFRAGSPENRIANLRSRVDHFREQHGPAQIEELCIKALEAAQKRFGICLLQHRVSKQKTT